LPTFTKPRQVSQNPAKKPSSTEPRQKEWELSQFFIANVGKKKFQMYKQKWHSQIMNDDRIV